MNTKPKNVSAPWVQTHPRGEHGGRTYYDKRYNTTQWRKVRALHLMEHQFCVECLALNPPVYTPATVVDHIRRVAVGGDFFNSSNHQGLCYHHHAVKSGKEAHK